jgi:biopolymer transport protein TolR
MAASGGYHDDDADPGLISDINVTPLVDITLVLLIIFMVTARLIVARGIHVESPQTVTGSEIEGPVELTIQPGPLWYVNGAPVAGLDDVARLVKRSLADDPELRAVITADRTVAHGDVMAVIDTVKLAGVKRFAMRTEVKRSE